MTTSSPDNQVECEQPTEPSVDSVARQTKPIEEIMDRIDLNLRRIETATSATISEAHPDFSLSIIVPVYNERQTLPQVLERIDEVFPSNTQTVIVDDASNDGTTAWLQSLPARLDRVILRRRRNHGKGSAVRLGIRHTRGSIVAIQDADLEYDPSDLRPMVKAILAGDADVVYGSRYLVGNDDASALHRIGNRTLTWLSNCMNGQSLTDMETCHKVFRGDLIRSIPIQECRFGFEPEITAKLAARGVQINEQATGYQSRSYDQGKKITWKDGFAAVGCMWRYRNDGWRHRLFAGLGRSRSGPLNR